MIYFWLAVIILSLAVEASTAILVAIWFVPAAAISMVLAVCNIPLTFQITVFLVISGTLMLLFYQKLRNHIASKTEKSGADSLIGKTGVVEEDIRPLSVGRVKVGGQSWSAYVEENDEEILKGELITVVSINGVKLLCKKKTECNTDKNKQLQA